MITFKSNLSQVMGSLVSKLQSLNTNDMSREISVSMLPEIRHRIHVQGQASDGGQIGTYSPGYLKFRQVGYKSPVVTRGDNKGQKRPFQKLNRTSDPTVVASATRNMEGDLSVQATPVGFGIGYTNQTNAKKVDYLQATYNKDIFDATSKENAVAASLAKKYVEGVLNG